MSPQRLVRLSITIFATFLMALLVTFYLGWDADRTQHCIDNGGTEASCGWR